MTHADNTVNRFLATTADERTWPQDKPVLFLGEWCRLYSRKSVWKDMDAEVAKYHWDDRKKLHADYLYLQTLYEELLKELAGQLNGIHGVNHSLRYWRILLGPWLGYFTQMLFDRWAMIAHAVANHPISGALVLDTPPDMMIPNDMDHFNKLWQHDAWNEVIYGQLLEGWTNVPVTKMAPVGQTTPTTRQPVSPQERWLKYSFGDAFHRAIGAINSTLASPPLVRENEAFFIATYLRVMPDLRLQWRLGQIPKIWKNIPTPKVKVDLGKRQWRLGGAGEKGFPAIVRKMIPRHIPAVYLEGYEELKASCATLPWPGKPSLIFASNLFGRHDVFKAWAAQKTEEGAPLVTGQHGGLYGMGLWYFMDDHQRAISDAFITWGWDVEGDPKIKPVGNLKLSGHDMKWNPRGDALMVEMARPRYSYHMFAMPVASQWLEYFEDQCRFVAALPERLRGSLLVRLYGADYEWSQKERWLERFPDIRLEEGKVPIEPLVENSRLSISTYNGTTFLEALTINIPSIIFRNPNHWEITRDAVPYFEKLKTVGIYHETPESAARHMAQVWDDVAGWWNSGPVQSARKEFCHRYSHMPEDFMDKMEGILRQTARKPGVTTL